ncbi:copper chaperone [Paraburkholderia sp. RAU2J]|uniref:heavy-metal-associated domain-containing protein n=1 Tax=Paraburkholderia sp. RAU2J TaxID=1938810 RepID=UPI000EAE5FF1|nr:heavy-metal-associated domain-containing protein [Paraburkholderia sp. RAU2J]RKT21035.1 copper chaperone [Paraburkholderia sp. RAU2J]
MEFAIPDMACGGCANAISRAVTRLDPAAKLDLDVALKRVEVVSTLSRQRLIKVIEAAGFHPSPGN